MRNRIRNNRKYVLLGLPTFFLLLSLTASLPPVRERLAGRIDNWRAQIEYMLDPPEEALFVPQEQRAQIALMVSGTLQALTPSPTPTPVSTTTPTSAGPTLTPSSTPTPTATPTPLPAAALLTGVEYHHQHGVWNYCGPTTLAMGLSYWGWDGDRYDTGAYLRGGLEREDDKNVMPYEMQNYVQDETNLRMLVRMGGDLPLLKALIAAGYPVLVEKDFQLEGVGWMGHYLLLIGYDDAQNEFVSMDSYRGENIRYGYEEVLASWRAFNYTFMVTYPPGQAEGVLAVLGPWADQDWAAQHALDIARGEVVSLTGRHRYFAWFNLGTSYVALRDYGSAASAFDSAFASYAELPKEERPWRMVWYQTSPYFAYFYTGRYYDVINLADTTLDAMQEPILEESFYWRGLAKEELGDIDGAIADLEESVRLNPNFEPGSAQLNRIRNGG